MANHNYYQLTYVEDDVELTMKFNTDKDIWQIADYLQDFLKGASFMESTVKKVFKEEYDE